MPDQIITRFSSFSFIVIALENLKNVSYHEINNYQQMIPPYHKFLQIAAYI